MRLVVQTADGPEELVVAEIDEAVNGNPRLVLSWWSSEQWATSLGDAIAAPTSHNAC